jgi:hypothetical protein
MREAADFQTPEQLGSWRNVALGIGGIATLVILAAALIFPDYREQALRSWLLGFIFWAGIGIGGLGIVLLQYLTGGAWGVVIRRTAEAASRTLPIIFILFLPILIGVTHLYEWTHLPADDYAIAHRGWYMTVSGWITRSIIYFILWGVMMYLLNKWSREQDAATDYEQSARILGTATRFSGPTLVIYCLVVSFAVVDWLMTLDPHWFSTIWGLLFVAGWALSCFCFSVIILAYLWDKAPMNRVLGKRHFHDLGKLMLALTMVWAYFNFSQFLIIYSGNIPEETVWYLARTRYGWQFIGVLLIVFHFAVPFLILLSRDIKRQPKRLAYLAAFILLMRVVDMYYIIGPSHRIHPPAGYGISYQFSILDVIAPIAVGGIWLWYFFGELMKRPLVPVKDPFLPNAIEHGRGH